MMRNQQLIYSRPAAARWRFLKGKTKQKTQLLPRTYHHHAHTNSFPKISRSLKKIIVIPPHNRLLRPWWTDTLANRKYGIFNYFDFWVWSQHELPCLLCPPELSCRHTTTTTTSSTTTTLSTQHGKAFNDFFLFFSCLKFCHYYFTSNNKTSLSKEEVPADGSIRSLRPACQVKIAAMKRQEASAMW
jgi:hypothetical protein